WPPAGRKHGHQWGEMMAVVGEKPMAIDTAARAIVLRIAMVNATVTAPEMIGLLAWWSAVLAAPVVLVRRWRRRRRGVAQHTPRPRRPLQPLGRRREAETVREHPATPAVAIEPSIEPREPLVRPDRVAAGQWPGTLSSASTACAAASPDARPRPPTPRPPLAGEAGATMPVRGLPPPARAGRSRARGQARAAAGGSVADRALPVDRRAAKHVCDHRRDGHICGQRYLRARALGRRDRRQPARRKDPAATSQVFGTGPARGLPPVHLDQASNLASAGRARRLGRGLAARRPLGDPAAPSPS